MEIPIDKNTDAMVFAKAWLDNKLHSPHDADWKQLACIIAEACRDYYEQKTDTRS